MPEVSSNQALVTITCAPSKAHTYFTTQLVFAAWVQRLKTYLSCYFLRRPALWYALICGLPPIPLTDFLCKWIAYVNAACSGFIAEPQQHTPVTYDKQEEKKCQFGYSEIPLLRGKLRLRAWACFPFLLTSFSLLIQYVASPCVPSLLPAIAQFSLHLFVLTFFLYTLTPTLFCFFLLLFFSFLSPSSFPCPSFPLSGGVLDQRGVLVPDCDNTSR